MAPTIHIMPPELANKIAAGEVVQRPASAVKELVENALDAAARRIAVHVRDAGRTFIQVVDDGSGLSAEDAALAVQRHATSKVRTAEDLEHIRTFGFRGEALASIAAVSYLELRTRRSDDEVATVVKVEGDTVRELSKAGAAVGTTVTVRNLFYNTPARRNFLKTRQTELKNIADVVTRAALVHPEIAWSLMSEEETLLDLRPETPEERASAILGERVGPSLMRCEERTDYLSLDGFLARPEYARRSRTEQYLSLNRRPIQNKMVAHAVFQGYEHLLINGGFPLFVLNLTMDPERVDVNVHPSKL
ncbi:MAG: DNA mismatch repair endonuclease MutL, partial [Bacteroidota bacterium]